MRTVIFAELVRARRPVADDQHSGGKGARHITSRYAASVDYYTAAGLSWYAVRAYYFNGPWSGPGYSYAGWSDYAARSGIGCTPGTAIKGGDGIMYNCQ